MNYDYQQTQAEVTYQLAGIGGWAYKKVEALGILDINAGPENRLFDTHRTEMDNAGWTLVSMEAIPGTLKPSSLISSTRSHTSNYELFWKRIKRKPVMPGLASGLVPK